MIKRALAVTICLLMVLVLLPKTARADNDDAIYTLYFHEGKLYTNSEYSSEYTGGNWRGSGNTLYLTNFHFITTAVTALSLPNSTTLVLEGTNTVEAKGEHVANYGVFCKGTLSIQGPGMLTATCGHSNGDSYGVRAVQDITVKSGRIIGVGGNASNYSYGVYAEGGITADGGSIEGTGGTTDDKVSYGVYAKQDITVKSGSIVGTGGEKRISYGVYSDTNITASGGSITGTGGKNSSQSHGVVAALKIVVNGGSIKGVGDVGAYLSCGIRNSNVEVNSGRLVGKAFFNATYASALSGSPQKPSTYYWRTGENDVYTKSSVGEFQYSEGLTYVDISSGPRIAVSVPAFGTGQAPPNEKITVEIDEDFDATKNFDSATMNDAPLDLGTVNIPGAHGSVENGSIVIRLNKAYLDTLPVGTHTLRVNLKGAYVGEYVETQITVLALGNGDAGADVPKTGDSATPMLWLMIALLASVGFAVSVVSRRKRQNG